ncbi:MAG: hypothetical protein JXB03_05265 [Spirochaetales bacterium]|nr:hypothetical protein [Spirochaetales bacterium]
MGKVSTEAKKRYFDKIKEYKSSIETISAHEKTLSALAVSEETKAGYHRLSLADLSLNMVSYYVLMNNLSVNLLGVKNEAYLNDARKGCYKSLIYLEEAVTNYIDAPFSEYEEALERISDYTEDKRYYLLRKLGFAIESVVDGFGKNTKWKWSFVELDGRYATVAKNLLYLKTINADLDPRADYYSERSAHLKLVKTYLQLAADRYREKYELSTLRPDDFKLAISYLFALRRLHIYLGESEDAEVIKKKADIWRSKMDTDSKKLEQRNR